MSAPAFRRYRLTKARDSAMLFVVMSLLLSINDVQQGYPDLDRSLRAEPGEMRADSGLSAIVFEHERSIRGAGSSDVDDRRS